jgi:hypothetical protein
MGTPQLPGHLQAAFIGTPVYVELPKGERLYKIVSLPVARERVLRSPWWIRQRTLDVLRLRALHLQRPLAEVVRSHLAIAVEWNPGMDTLWIVVLAARVPAWEGRARTQPVSTASREVVFLGGGQQVCVPDLKPGQIAQEYTGYLPV